MEGEKLFQEFPGTSSQEWRDKIEADLKGADFYKKLVWKTEEGFDIQPYYRDEDLETLNAGAGVQSAGEGNNWKIRQDFCPGEDAALCNQRLLEAIARGVESVGLDFGQSPDLKASDIETLLEGIDTGIIDIHVKNLSEGHQKPDFLGKVFDLVAHSPKTAQGSLGVDPIGKLVKTGKLEQSSLDGLPVLVEAAAATWPKFKTITLDAGHFQDGGATLSQELAFGLSMANSYFTELTNLGMEASKIAGTLAFEFVTGPNYFMEIAKLRAARWLWRVVLNEWGVDPEKHPMYIHSRTASWNLTVYDANVNMLRTTTEAMSASLGGSDSISVVPFDSLYKEENDFTARIARNTQIILKEEAYFSKVADPASGSYYIEQLTEELGNKAWEYFLDIEDKGGFIEVFKSGYIKEQVLASAKEKSSKAASRRSSILGVNQYPNFSELLIEQGIEIPAAVDDSKQGIPAFRISTDLEEMRMQTEKSSIRPKVFLLKYGDPVWMTARAMFSSNFFACAGYEIIDNPGFDSLEAGLDAAKNAKANIVVLCSSDAFYPEIGPAALTKLKGSAEVVIAGYPKDAMDLLQKAGIKHFIHVRTNLLDELKKFNTLLLK